VTTNQVDYLSFLASALGFGGVVVEVVLLVLLSVSFSSAG
jgi:hypothetical protein